MLLLRTSRGVDPGIPLLRSLGSNAHVWAPGANGTTVASLPSNNYLLSDGSTGYSTVDGVVGLDLDAMGALGSELITNGTFDTDTTWTKGAGWTIAGEAAVATGVTAFVAIKQSATLSAGKTYLVTYTVSSVSSGGVRVTFFGGAGVVGVDRIAPGTYYEFMVAVAGSIEVGFQAAGAGFAGSVDNISVKEYTGTHLTQATTANKPLVRRGALNLQDWSENISGATGWASAGMQVGSTVTLPASSGVAFRAYKTGAITANTAYVASVYIPPAAFWSDPSASFKLTWFGLDAARTNFTPNTVNAGAGGWITCAVSAAVVSAATTLDFRLENLTASTITCSQPFKVQIEAGITAGDYTPTTSTAASNPSAGKYWWSFDGSNDSMLSGNLGITNACTIVIAGRLNNLATNQVLFAENTNGARIYVNTTGGIVFDNGTTGMAGAAAVIAAGVPFVITVRLSSGTAVIRLNGVQVATSATAVTFSAITGARIGTAFDGTSNPTGGAIGWVVPIAQGLSDADCLTVERLVGAQFPGMATF